MSAAPLTHHEIVRLVEPFARAGRHVDLAASDRPARRIAFRAREAMLEAAPGVVWQEGLELEARPTGHFVLRRTLTHPDGTQAILEAGGSEPGALLARVDAVPLDRHLSAGEGWRVLRSYDADVPAAAGLGSAGEPPLALTTARLQAGGLTLDLRMKLPRLRSVAADLELTATANPAPELPEDLLAVLGWDWARLVRHKGGWSTRLRLRGPVLRRSRTAERALDRAGAHLARTLAEPPAAFHDRHRLARWGVVLRRGIPSLMVVLMIGGALLLPRVVDPEKMGMWMALHYLPIALLAFAFSLQELARFEIPPVPRRSTAGSWGTMGG